MNDVGYLGGNVVLEVVPTATDGKAFSYFKVRNRNIIIISLDLGYLVLGRYNRQPRKNNYFYLSIVH